MPDSLNKQHLFAPHDIAGMFDVSVMTVRRWADYHKEHLSESANPPAGQKRWFTWGDVEKLRQIKAWRDAGLSVDAINNRLTNAVTGAITPTVMADSLDAQPSTRNDSYSPSTVIVEREDIVRLFTRVEALEQSQEKSRQNRVSDIVLGVLLALGFMIVILLLALIYGIR